MSMGSPVRIVGRLDEPDKKDVFFASTVHVVSIFSPLWGPLIAWGIFRTSRRFVAAHAWAAIVEFMALKIALLIAGLISLGFTVSSLVNHYHSNWEHFSWWPIIAKVLLTWIALLILGAITTVLSIRQAYRAYLGHWPVRDVRKAQRAEKDELKRA